MENHKQYEDHTFKVIGCAIEVHRMLGPGLLESTYEQCLAYELARSGIQFKQQAPISLQYKNVRIDCGYRADFLIQDSLIVELKTIGQILKIHHAQLLTYMKLASVPLGLLINFNSVTLKEGIERFRL